MKQFSLRLPDNLHKAITETAKQNRRSKHAEILRAIEYYLKEAPEAHYRVEEIEDEDQK